MTDPVLAPVRSAWQLPSTRARVIVTSAERRGQSEDGQGATVAAAASANPVTMGSTVQPQAAEVLG